MLEVAVVFLKKMKFKEGKKERERETELGQVETDVYMLLRGYGEKSYSLRSDSTFS